MPSQLPLGRHPVLIAHTGYGLSHLILRKICNRIDFYFRPAELEIHFRLLFIFFLHSSPCRINSVSAARYRLFVMNGECNSITPCAVCGFDFFSCLDWRQRANAWNFSGKNAIPKAKRLPAHYRVAHYRVVLTRKNLKINKLFISSW